MLDSMTNTVVLTFGDEVSDDSGSVSLAIDPRHKDDDGEFPTSYLPGTVVYFLIYHDTDTEILSVSATDGGEAELLSTTTATVEIDQQVFPSAEAVSLSIPPVGDVSASTFYGRTATLTTDIENSTVKASAYPVMADISYQARVTKARDTFTSSIDMTTGDSMPVALVVTYKATS